MSWEQKILRILQYGSALAIMTPLFYNTNFIFPYIFPKNIIFRILIIFLTIVLAIYWQINKKWRLGAPLIFYGLLVFLMTMSGATLLGPDSYNSFWGGWERMDGLLNLFFLSVYLVVLTNVFKTKNEWLWLMRVTIFTAVTVCFYGLIKNGFNIANNTWTTLGNSAFLGYYLLLNFLVTIILLKFDNNKKRRVFYIGSGIILLLFILGAASRAPIIALGVSLFFIGATSFSRMSIKARIIFLSGVLFIFCGSALITVNKNSLWVNKINFVNRLAHISNSDPTTNNRLLIWQSGWEAFKDKPIIGYGPENITIGINKHYNPLISEQWFDRTHNFILDYLLAGGILGLAGYLFFILSGLYYSLRIRKKDYLLGNILISFFVGYWSTLLFVFDTLNSSIIIMMMMAFCGWLWRYNFGDKADSEQEVNGKSRNVCLHLSLAAVAMGTIFFYPAVIKPVKANLFAGNAYRYSQADPQKSINYYDKIFAVKTFGMREICMHLIRYATIAINAPEASEEIKKLIFTKAEEKSLEYLKVSKANSLQVRVGLAQLYLLYGEKNIFYYDKAIEILVDNIGDSPGRVEIYYIIASAYNEKGEIDNALEYLEKAYSVGKGVKSVYTNLMNLYAKKGEADKTSRIIENYLKQFNDLSAEEYRLAAEYYFKVDRTEEAKKVLIDYAIPAEPNSWRVYVSYASILENEGKISEAIEYLENRATEYPESADVFNQYVEYLNSIKK